MMWRLVLLSVVYLPYIAGQSAFVGVDPYGDTGEVEEGPSTEGLNEMEKAQIDNTVTQLAAQITDKLKGHLTEEMKAQKHKSKLGSSRISPTSELYMAAANNQFERAAKLLSEGTDPDAVGPQGIMALHSAAEQGYKDIVDLLLAYNASVNAPGPNGVTPLHMAAQKGRNSVTELLLREGAFVEATTAEQLVTPLYLASEMGHTRVVTRLLETNASSSSRAQDGSTALHVAAREGHEAVVQALLDAGASVDEQDNAGARAIHYASVAGHMDVVEQLTLAGAAPVTDEELEEHSKRQRGRVKVEMTTATFTMAATG